MKPGISPSFIFGRVFLPLADKIAATFQAALIAMEEDLTNAREVLPHHYETALGRVKPRTSTQQIEFYDNYIKTAKGVNIIC